MYELLTDEMLAELPGPEAAVSIDLMTWIDMAGCESGMVALSVSGSGPAHR